MQDFRKLLVWQEAQALAVSVHIATRDLRGNELAAFRSQIRRSSASIAANIAEGASAGGANQFARYLQMAIGSATETESHLDFADRLGLLQKSELDQLTIATVRLRRRTISLRKRVLASAGTDGRKNSQPTNSNPEPAN